MYNAMNFNVTQTQVVLDKANFNVIGTVDGVATATYLLGIGGLSEKSLKGNAIADMYERANLKGSQAIINVNFKRCVEYVLIVQEIEYTASGVIIEFVDDNNINEERVDSTPVSVSKAEEQEPKATDDGNTINTIKVGSIVKYNGHAATVCQVRGSEVVLFAYGDFCGTWDESIVYCGLLDGDWKLPTVDEFKSIKHLLNAYDNGVDGYWTSDEVGDKRVRYFDLTYKTDYSILKERKLNALVITRVNIDDLIKVQ